MDIKLNILVFGAEWNNATARLGNVLRFMFKGHLPMGREIAYYESVNEALPAFSTRFQGTDVVLLLADISDYAHIKSLLAKALHLELRSSPEIAKNTRQSIGDFEAGSEEMLAHCSVPTGRQAFCLGDGLYAGFALTAGKQQLILLPHDKDRTVTLLNQQVIPYLNSFYGNIFAADASLRYYANELAALLTGFEEKAGVSGTKTAVFIRGAAEKVPNLPPMLRFTPSAEAIGKLHPIEYAANLSIAACELEGNPYGMAMTNAFFTGQEATPDTEKCVYIAFTDDHDTGVREIYSFNGEEIPDFLTRCTEELFKFAIERIRFVHAPKEIEQAVTTSFISRGKMAALAVIAALAVAVGATVSYFITRHHMEEQNQQQNSSIVEDAAEQA